MNQTKPQTATYVANLIRHKTSDLLSYTQSWMGELGSILPNPVSNHTNTEFSWYTASRDFSCSSFSVRLGVPNRSTAWRKYRYYQPSLLHWVTQLLVLHDYWVSQAIPTLTSTIEIEIPASVDIYVLYMSRKMCSTLLRTSAMYRARLVPRSHTAYLKVSFG